MEKRANANAVIFAVFLAEMSATFESAMIFGALPKLIHEYGDPVKAGWLVTMHMLVSAATYAVAGRLGDIKGRKLVMLALIAIAACGSLVSAVTTSFAMVLAGRALHLLENARDRRSWVGRVVAGEEPQLVGPRRAGRILLRGLEAREYRLALAREDDRIEALHSPEVREVEDVVGRADDERVELLLGHERADALELRVVARPAHIALRGEASSRSCFSNTTTARSRAATPVGCCAEAAAVTRPRPTGARARAVAFRGPRATR